MELGQPSRRPTNPSCLALVILTVGFVLWSSALSIISVTYAQVTNITSSGLNTQVAAPRIVGGETFVDITGGTRPGGGPNIFHSFGRFDVGRTAAINDIGNFLNRGSVDLAGNLLADGLPTSNILARVTAGNPSSIFGTIQTTGFGNANLFLMNPAGFLFGPNATVNVGGMVTFTSADYLRLTDGVRFNVIPDATADALLSTAPVAAFGFLGSNPGAITVQGGQLSVAEGTGISLVGGNITVQSGTLENEAVQPARLSAPGGQINLASVASPGEVLYSSLQYGPNINGQSFSSMGSITVSGGSTLDVSADAAGTVRIRGGQFEIADATISADTGNTNGTSVAVDINLTGDLSISDTRGAPVITARATGAGNAGEVHIESANLDATSNIQALFALIDTHTSGTGRAGEVYITSGNLEVVGPNTTQFTFIDSGTEGSGDGNNTTINAASVDLNSTAISTGDHVARNRFLEPSGSAGNLTVAADSFQGDSFILSTEAFGAFADSQRGGDISITGRGNPPATINLVNGQVLASGMDRGGAITINNLDSLVTDFTFFETFTVFGPGGGITANGRVIELTNGSSFNSNTFGDGPAGGISVIGTDHVSLLGVTGPDPLGIHRPSGIFSNSFGDLGPFGRAGDTFVMTPILTMTEGRINNSTATSGGGGTVTVNAGTVTISGEFPNPDFQGNPIFTITDIPPSGIFTETVGNEVCSGPCGDAGNIIANIGSLVMGPGSQLNSGTSSTGQGGTITINAANTISMSGTLSDGTPVGVFSRTIGTDSGSGVGGNITATAGQSVTLSNGASISASSTGPANAGNISINAGATFLMENSSVTTQATQASGGKIEIKASDMARLTNSQINTSVADGTGGGGNITIDPNFVILQNSQILAQAFAGQGGNITITTGTFLPDANSLVDASSQFGLSGTVTIQSPTSNLSAVWARLQQNYAEAAALLRARCAAQVSGQYGSFVLAGRDSLPLEPGGWLLSPMAALSAGEGRVARGEGARSVVASSVLASEGGILSLRGFDQNLSWQEKTTSRFASVLDSACGS